MINKSDKKSPAKAVINKSSDTLINEGQTADKKNVVVLHSKLPWFRKLTFTNAFSEKANKLGIFTSEQLITHLPNRYEDLSKITKINAVEIGESAQFEVMIKSITARGFGRKRSYSLVVSDGSADAIIRFFNLYPAQLNILKPGALLRIYGELRNENHVKEFLHPRWSLAEKAPPLQNILSPIYPLTNGLNQAVLRNQINRVMELMPYEILPASIAQDPRFAKALPTLKMAFEYLHQPPTDTQIEHLLSTENPARKRLAFDELLSLQILLQRLRERIRTRLAKALIKNNLPETLINMLPFSLTKAQKKVWQEISFDLNQSVPMARLLQGDVGSGKTIIALLACLKAIDNGGQAVVMAPTEILAEQHYQRFTEILRPLGINVGWLTSSVGQKERKVLANLVQQKLINLVVGTHALIEDTLKFPNLVLAVIDEQHRFGVHQRLRLQEREEISSEVSFAPHQLMMSATPIPRTLAMSHYAHLDLSTIDELPPGRQVIKTRLVNSLRRSEIIKYLLNAINEGRQVYWICPLIEESEVLQLQTAEQTFINLIQELPELSQQNKIGLLHGRMSTTEKSQVMSNFSANKISLLISTTVVEVGVDVANACYMVIENAERFGLSQLHQLRGRIGRGIHQSVCILLFQEPLTDIAKSRLKVIYEHTDGFVVAKEDLRIRGPGEIVGDKQSGLPTLRFANIINDFELLLLAQEVAPKIIRENPEICEQLILFWFGGGGQLYST